MQHEMQRRLAERNAQKVQGSVNDVQNDAESLYEQSLWRKMYAIVNLVWDVISSIDRVHAPDNYYYKGHVHKMFISCFVCIYAYGRVSFVKQAFPCIEQIGQRKPCQGTIFESPREIVKQ